MNRPYMYWVTGLAGVGKTTIGTALYERLLTAGRRVVLLDGDRLREAFGGQHGYSAEERHRLAMCYARLCKMLVDQGNDVVCATVSMFASVRQWNRDHIDDYREIYIIAPEEHMLSRRAFYTDPVTLHEVVSFSEAYQLPTNPDVIIHNDAETAPAQLAEYILVTLGITL